MREGGGSGEEKEATEGHRWDFWLITWGDAVSNGEGRMVGGAGLKGNLESGLHMCLVKWTYRICYLI